MSATVQPMLESVGRLSQEVAGIRRQTPDPQGENRFDSPGVSATRQRVPLSQPSSSVFASVGEQMSVGSLAPSRSPAIFDISSETRSGDGKGDVVGGGIGSFFDDSPWEDNGGSHDPPGTPPKYRGGGGGGRSGGSVNMTLTSGIRCKEADKIEGIQQFPSVAAWPGWRREVYRCTAAAAWLLQEATNMLLAAETWKGEPQDIVLKPAWYKLDAMLGKELKRILKTEVNLLRKVCTAEDKALRTTFTLLPGLSMYVIIHRHFRHDERLAKAQAMEELQQCVYTNGLFDFMTRWDRSLEAFCSAGRLSDSDEVILYTLFKRSFLTAKEMQEHIAVFRRAAPGSDIHIYDWMYNTCKAVLANERHEQVASERVASHKPGASDLATPALPDQRKEKDKEKQRIACPALVKQRQCKDRNCPYDHSEPIVSAAVSTKGKGKSNDKDAKGDPKGGKDPKGKGKGKNEENRGKGNLTDEEFKTWAATKPCSRFSSKVGCKFGDSCYFKHDQGGS